MKSQLFLLAHTQQPGGKTGIDEIEFVSLDEPFVEITEMGTQQENDVTRHKHRFLTELGQSQLTSATLDFDEDEIDIFGDDFDEDDE